MLCHACGVANAASASGCIQCGASLRASGDARPAASSLDIDARYAPSTVAMSPSRHAGVGELTREEAWAIAVGPAQADYYLPRFARLAAGGGASWHWPAFFVTWWWLLYRKMWGWAALYFFMPYLFTFGVGVVLGMSGLDYQRSDDVFLYAWLAYLVGMFVLPPLFANQLYFARIRKLVARTRSQSGSTEQFVARLEARGGTSWLWVGILLFLFVTFTGVLAAVAIPAYRTYTVQAHLDEVARESMTLAESISKHYKSSGQLPRGDSLQLSSPYVQGVHLNETSGVLTVEVRDQRVVGSLVLVPEIDKDRNMYWGCTTPDLRRYAPFSCRYAAP
jgi:hypothetical protein